MRRLRGGPCLCHDRCRQEAGHAHSERSHAQLQVDARRECSLEELARELDRLPAHFTRIVRLNYLIRGLVMAIFDGTQMAASSHDIFADSSTDDWLQRKPWGFAACGAGGASATRKLGGVASRPGSD